jgi:hypothetical protein
VEKIYLRGPHRLMLGAARLEPCRTLIGATLKTEVVTILMRASGKPALRTHRKPCFLLVCQFDSSFLSGGGVVFPHRVWFQVTACSPSWLG